MLDQVAAESLAEVSLKYKIVAVPTVLFVKVGDGIWQSGVSLSEPHTKSKTK